MNEIDNEYQLMNPLGISLEENNLIISNNLKNKNVESAYKKAYFDKIIIPYNFKKNSYSIPDEEIEGYENKEFVLNTLHNYNTQQLFKFDSSYGPSFCERILFLIISLLIILIILYIVLFLLFIFLFNPLVIYISYKFLDSIIFLIKGYKNTLYEKLKKKAINKKLEETNNSKYCKEHKIRWSLGVSGYWLEVEKIRQGGELQEYK